jgi:uncharacterized protein involved in exopolysaccharide biosynthesis
MTFDNPIANPVAAAPIALRDWSLAELFQVALRGWKWIAVSVVVSILLAMAVIRFSTPIYTITMVVGPRTAGLTQGADLGIASRLLGAAASQQGANFELYTQLLVSNVVGRRLVEEHHFERRLWAANWNETTQQWTPPSGVVPAIAGAAKSVLGWPKWQPPGPQDVSDFLGRMIQISSTKAGLFSASSIYRVSIRSADAQLAVDLLNLLHKEADTILRSQRMKELDAGIAYLEMKLRETTIVAAQNALSEALASAIRERVLLLGDSSYAAILVDPPAMPKRPSSPQPALLLAGALVLGGGVGFALALLRHRRRLLKS